MIKILKQEKRWHTIALSDRDYYAARSYFPICFIYYLHTIHTEEELPMKSAKFSTFLRSFAFAAALIVTTVLIPATNAHALDNRNCVTYLQIADINDSLASYYEALGETGWASYYKCKATEARNQFNLCTSPCNGCVSIRLECSQPASSTVSSNPPLRSVSPSGTLSRK